MAGRRDGPSDINIRVADAAASITLIRRYGMIGLASGRRLCRYSPARQVPRLPPEVAVLARPQFDSRLSPRLAAAVFAADDWRNIYHSEMAICRLPHTCQASSLLDARPRWRGGHGSFGWRRKT